MVRWSPLPGCHTPTIMVPTPSCLVDVDVDGAEAVVVEGLLHLAAECLQAAAGQQPVGEAARPADAGVAPRAALDPGLEVDDPQVVVVEEALHSRAERLQVVADVEPHA